MPRLPDPKHELFCQLRVKGKSQIDAYSDTGYYRDDGNASKFEKQPHIKARIEELQNKSAELACVDKAWVLTTLVELTERCMNKVPVLDHKGKKTGEWKFEANGANAAIDKIAKHLGFYEKDNEQKNPDPSIIENVKSKLFGGAIPESTGSGEDSEVEQPNG